jgi:hypothetical protein
VRGKWFEVNDLNHSATDAPQKSIKNDKEPEPYFNMFYLFRVDNEVDNITIDRGYDVDV